MSSSHPPASNHTEPSSAVTPNPLCLFSLTSFSSFASTNLTHTTVPTNTLHLGVKHVHSLALFMLTTFTAMVIPASFCAAGTSPACSSRMTATAEHYASSTQHTLTHGTTSIPSQLEAFHLYLCLMPLFVLCVVLPALTMLMCFFCLQHKAMALVTVASAGAKVGASGVRNKVMEDVLWGLNGMVGRNSQSCLGYCCDRWLWTGMILADIVSTFRLAGNLWRLVVQRVAHLFGNVISLALFRLEHSCLAHRCVCVRFESLCLVWQLQ